MYHLSSINSLRYEIEDHLNISLEKATRNIIIINNSLKINRRLLRIRELPKQGEPIALQQIFCLEKQLLVKHQLDCHSGQVKAIKHPTCWGFGGSRLPPNCKTVGCIWVDSVKRSNTCEKYRVCGLDTLQEEGRIAFRGNGSTV